MDIWKLIVNHIQHSPTTLSLDESVPLPAGFRGELGHTGELCVACGTCAYACSPGAIRVERTSGTATWTYDSGQCTFCGQCVRFCPTQALDFTGARLAARYLPAATPCNGTTSAVARDPGRTTRHVIQARPCPGCGAPVYPLPEVVLQRMFPSDATALAEEWNGLCERCRARRHVEKMRTALTGESKARTLC